MKSNKRKGIIRFLIIIIITILISTIIIVTFNSLKFNLGIEDSITTTTSSTTTNVSTTSDKTIEFKVDNNYLSNTCNHISDNEFYSYDKNYIVEVNNIMIKNKNYSFKYEVDYKNGTFMQYLNSKLINEGTINESLLVDVCNYGNYIVYSFGWEGSPHYFIIDTEGNLVMDFVGLNVEYKNNLLYVSELTSKSYTDFITINYQLDMDSNKLVPINKSEIKYNCDEGSINNDSICSYFFYD